MNAPMTTFDDCDTINAILAECVTSGMVEPIDCPDCHPMDWAEVTGLADELLSEIYPEAYADMFPEDDFIVTG